MIDPLRFTQESYPAYELERPAFCVSCLSSRQTRNNPNVAVVFCHECPNVLSGKKEYGALLCSVCEEEKHKHSLNHARQIVVVGPAVRKKVLVRGDAITFPRPLDNVVVKLRATIFSNGRRVHKEPWQTLRFTTGMSGRCLHIQLLGARDLKGSDNFTLPDPFVLFSYCGKPLVSTRVRMKRANPSWQMETFIVPVDDWSNTPRRAVASQKELVKLEVFDRELFGNSRLVGHVEISRSKLMKLAVVAGEKPVRLPLTFKEHNGLLQLQLGHTDSHFRVRVLGAEDLDKQDVDQFSRVFVRLKIGDRPIGETNVSEPAIHPLWTSANEFSITLSDLLEIEAQLETQIAFYRSSTGSSVQQLDSQPVHQHNHAASERERRRGRAQGLAKLGDLQAAMEEFEILPDFLSLLSCEVFEMTKTFTFEKERSIGKVNMPLRLLRQMLPSLPDQTQRAEVDEALVKNLELKQQQSMAGRASRLLSQLPKASMMSKHISSLTTVLSKQLANKTKSEKLRQRSIDSDDDDDGGANGDDGFNDAADDDVDIEGDQPVEHNVFRRIDPRDNGYNTLGRRKRVEDQLGDADQESGADIQPNGQHLNEDAANHSFFSRAMSISKSFFTSSSNIASRQQSPQNRTSSQPTRKSFTALSALKDSLIGPAIQDPEPIWSDAIRWPITRQSIDTPVKRVRDGEEMTNGSLIVRLLISSRGQVCVGVDRAVQCMTMGESAVVKCRFDALYGSCALSSRIPPRANAVVRLRLLDVEGLGAIGFLQRMLRRIIRLIVFLFCGIFLVFQRQPTSVRNSSAHKLLKKRLLSMFGLAKSSEDSDDNEDDNNDSNEGSDEEEIDDDFGDEFGDDGQDNIGRDEMIVGRMDKHMRKHLNNQAREGVRLMWGRALTEEAPKRKVARRRPPSAPGGDMATDLPAFEVHEDDADADEDADEDENGGEN